jgi:putative oxidoreductase
MNLNQYKPMLRSKGTLVGRVLLALLFVFSGVGMLMGGIGNTAMYFESMGLPMATLLAIAVIIVKIGGGLALAAGYRVEEAALALCIFTGLTILVAHRSIEDMGLWKNLSIMGGMLYVMAYGAGEGWRLKK